MATPKQKKLAGKLANGDKALTGSNTKFIEKNKRAVKATKKSR